MVKVGANESHITPFHLNYVRGVRAGNVLIQFFARILVNREIFISKSQNLSRVKV